MATVPASESFQFQAETTQLLNLMIHSLYTQREIFLRELISNASDALDRLRFEALTNLELVEDGHKYEIRLKPDVAARTLTISDTGIGMSRQELIEHIGSIARSGTRELRKRMKESQSSQAVADLIGQFGVGFYSSFMVADKVTILTRRAGESSASLWESAGEGVYTMADAEKPSCGTDIILHLKPVDAENGIEDYTDRWKLSMIVHKYSDFIAYPIIHWHDRSLIDSKTILATLQSKRSRRGAPTAYCFNANCFNANSQNSGLPDESVDAGGRLGMTLTIVRISTDDKPFCSRRFA